VDFVNQLTDNPDKMKEKANKQLETALERASLIARKGLLDGFALCSDYCFNTGPFLSPGIYTLEWI
jgi:uroporphyrinogen decarboxylase